VTGAAIGTASSLPRSESERCGMRKEPARRTGPAEDGEHERPVAGGNSGESETRLPRPRWRVEEHEGCVAGEGCVLLRKYVF